MSATDPCACGYADRCSGFCQVNGILVHTTPGPEVTALFDKHDLKGMQDKIQLQQDGTTVYGRSVCSSLKVRLVPHNKHESVLGGLIDTYDNKDLFTRDQQP